VARCLLGPYSEKTVPHPKVALIVATSGLLLALPGAANAEIDPGVNYDPGSPAGKEYAIPLVEGRSDAAGTTNQRSGGNIPFGVGITPPGGEGGGNGGGKSGSGRGAGGTGGPDRATRGEVQGARPGESARELAARIAQAEEPGGTAAARTLLLALAVLLPAALLALLLMQRGQVSRTGKAA
jgi:hypothetical protein